MLAEMTSREMEEWKAYADLEPFGPLNEWWQVAHIKWAIAASQGDKRQPKEFYPDFAGDLIPKDQSIEQIIAGLQSLDAAVSREHAR